MKLGIYTNTADLQKTRPFQWHPTGQEQADDDPIFHLRPWTRTTQGVVDRRAKGKNVATMDAEQALKGIGVGDKRSEAYTRELADFLIADWENIVAANDFVDPETGEEFKKGDPLPCITKYKVMLFEDVNVAVEIVKAAQSFATLQISDESKNFARSSDGTPVPLT